jgi:DHA2 family multidrug resistance protein
MLLLGVVLLGSTVLIPQFAQGLLGYTATDAGLVLSPGALLLMAFMPVVGFLVSRFDARLLVAFGLVTGGGALIWLSTFSLDVDYRKLVIARCFQAVGIGFIFVPINTLSYAFVPREKTNSASGLINLARNIGGSFGIAVMTTLVSRRAQVHQSYLVTHVTPYDLRYRTALLATSRVFHAPARVARQAYGAIYAEISRQATMLAYADGFRYMAIFFFGSLVFLLLLKKVKPGAAAPVH